jgi:hypothetical protein
LKLRASLLDFWKTTCGRGSISSTSRARRCACWHRSASDGRAALDAYLGRLRDRSSGRFQFVLAKLNEVINVVNRIVTLDGLLQRVALIRSLARDYQFAWRAIAQPYTRAVTDSDREQANHKLGVKPLTQIEHETREYIHGRGGPRAALLEEMAVIWRKQLRES